MSGRPVADGPVLADPGGPLHVVDLGTVPYREALALQERLRDARRAGAVGDLLLLLEHPPVYTRGRRASADELPFGDAWYGERGIEIVDVARGGKATYHGPGQLVGYLVVATRDVIGLVGAIERAMVAVARDRGIDARGRAADGIAFTGAWVGDRKLGSIGLHLAHGVTTHGLGLNVVTDLTPFEWIVPCGLTTPMTSIAREAGDPDLASDPGLDASAAVRAAGERVAAALAGELGIATVALDAAAVRALAAAHGDVAPTLPEPADRRAVAPRPPGAPEPAR
ncbi:Octanoate-[acyl-carrier-protein]-protein-N-octanoyltransferase [Patulibacter medicamentivorans]|uniref:Octanoyltransferase n=1 Tax=Patulibacter medicamentivorans TaxID=1097667 RepID=H0E5G7_9ACTN|nr:lipoyl(octanoyl) transferase LipB [Patulibacter medicamentivorans]EHN11076.1 Octanoate-[acyl-carrier-protein]-protein-N-octanoyltransferase [Patulibacter medicamentivorans]